MSIADPTLTEFYKREHSERAASRKPYGTTGARNAGDQIVSLIRSKRAYIKTVMDFGAGSRTLGKYVAEQLKFFGEEPVKWTDYDPAIPGIDTAPEGTFDLVVSSDVLEHIPEEDVPAVISFLGTKAAKYQFHHIACDPAGLMLPDGRNAHLTCQPPSWWLDKFGVASQAHIDNRFDETRNHDGAWILMAAHDVLLRKRGKLRRHCVIELDRK